VAVILVAVKGELPSLCLAQLADDKLKVQRQLLDAEVIGENAMFMRDEEQRRHGGEAEVSGRERVACEVSRSHRVCIPQQAASEARLVKRCAL